MTQDERVHHRALWRQREAALRGPVLPIVWALVERGVKLTTEGGHVFAEPFDLTPDELAVLREHPTDTRLLVELAAGDVEVANYAVQ